MPDVHRVTIVTDATMTRLGFVDGVDRVLKRRPEPVTLQIIGNVEPEPSIDSVHRGARLIRDFRPDTIITLGGGSPMDAAKVMWLLHEHPYIDFADMRHMGGRRPRPPAALGPHPAAGPVRPLRQRQPPVSARQGRGAVRCPAPVPEGR